MNISEQERLILAEVARRDAERAQVEGLCQQILGELFDKQIDFVNDLSRDKGALCTRRAGKTSMWSRYATVVGLRNPRTLIRIWGISRLRAKQLLWAEFMYLLKRHNVPLAKEPNETELTIFLGNGTEIRLLGADKDKEVQKKRGDKTILEVVLEAQLFGPFLKALVDDVVGPCLFDLKGTLCLEGTPGAVCAGHWFTVSGGNDFASRWQGPDGWSMHRWSVLDNPHIEHRYEELERLKAKKRWADDNPTYLREWCGRWVNDFGALFYKFDPVRNTYDPKTFQPWGPGWIHTLGWDLGAIDDMALVVWGYHPQHAELYEAFSWKKPGASADEVMTQIKKLRERGLNITKMVADTQGGGKMYVEEVMRRFSETFEPAKKNEKVEHVILMNDDYRGGFIKLARGSALAEEVQTLPIDPDWSAEAVHEKPPHEDSRFPNHCADAHLYAWRACMHYMHREVKPKPNYGSSEWNRQKEAEIVKALAKGHEAQQNVQTWLERYDQGLGDFE